VVAEALTNVAKYADASGARVSVERADGRLCVQVATTVSAARSHRQRQAQACAASPTASRRWAGDWRSPASPGTGRTVRAELPLDAC